MASGLDSRNAEIYALRNKGLTYRELGERFNLTKERIRQIVMREARRIRMARKKRDVNTEVIA